MFFTFHINLVGGAKRHIRVITDEKFNKCKNGTLIAFGKSGTFCITNDSGPHGDIRSHPENDSYR